MHGFRRNYAIEAARKSPLAIIRPFARHRGIRRARYNLLTEDVLDEMVDLHWPRLEEEGFNANDLESFRQLDLALEVSRRGDTAVSFYLAVEVSYSGKSDDVDRACTRAGILRAVTQMDAYPIVASVFLDRARIEGRISDNIDEFVRENNPQIAYWHRLED